MVGPRIGASTIPMLNKPIDIPFERAGQTLKVTAMASGCTTPAAIPWRTRPIESTSALVATPLMAEPTRKIKSAARNPNRWPKLLISHALTSMPAVIEPK